MFVGFHVIGVDIGDHCQDRLQHQKRRVRFIGFGDQKLTLAQSRVGIRGDQPAADDERRIEPALRQYAGDKTGGRRLAVRPGHRDPLLEPHQFRQHQCAWHHRNAFFPRSADLGIIVSHGGRHDDDIRASDIVGSVTHRDAGTQCGQAARHGRRRNVRSADLITLGHQHFRNAAHAGATDADKVNAFDFVLHRDRASSMHASATRSVASVRATLRAAMAIASKRSRS